MCRELLFKSYIHHVNHDYETDYKLSMDSPSHILQTNSSLREAQEKRRQSTVKMQWGSYDKEGPRSEKHLHRRPKNCKFEVHHISAVLLN